MLRLPSFSRVLGPVLVDAALGEAAVHVSDDVAVQRAPRHHKPCLHS